MTIYVDAGAWRDGTGSKERPFRHINDAAKIARPGDEVLVAPGIYREYVDPVFGGTEDARITYRSTRPLGAVITGAERIRTWKPWKGNVWVCRIPNSVFGTYNPYTTYVYGDWYFAGRSKHTGAVYLDGQMLYEAPSAEACVEPVRSPYSWSPEDSDYQWYAEVEGDETVIYANIQGKNPNEENVEINVRRNCFLPSRTGVNYITVDGFDINKAATTWAPPAAYQDGMIGPHWSKGWIIENCDISNSKCAGISLGKYYDPENDHYFTTRHVKSATQMERDATCRGQYHGWLKEKVGSHLIRNCNIHHCQQGGIIGRMGGVFSVIEDNHIHHINNMMELGGAEIAGIKMHAAIDVTIRRNHIHHCTMGLWMDWQAQGTRISQNLLHDNQRPAFAQDLPGGMCSQDIFVEVSHGPTLIDNNILLSDASLRMASQGLALVHNLICGSLTSVGNSTCAPVEGIMRSRYTPYHMHHRTEVMGFMTILHGDDRFYNNIFVQKWPLSQEEREKRQDEGEVDCENRQAGTHVMNGYPTYDEWIANFDMDSETPHMWKLEPFHFRHLPVWAGGNVYFNGAKAWKHEQNNLVDNDHTVTVEVVEKDGRPYLSTNLYEFLHDFRGSLISTDTLGRAFEPEQPFENPDGTPITFDADYFGSHRSLSCMPGPIACSKLLERPLF